MQCQMTHFQELSGKDDSPQSLQDILYRERGTADDEIGSSVVDGECIAVDDCAVCEDDAAEEAIGFIVRLWLHDRVVRAGNDPCWIVEIAKQHSQAVAILLVGSVINF